MHVCIIKYYDTKEAYELFLKSNNKTFTNPILTKKFESKDIYKLLETLEEFRSRVHDDNIVSQNWI